MVSQLLKSRASTQSPIFWYKPYIQSQNFSSSKDTFKNEHCANVRNCYPYHGKPLSPSLTSSRLGNSAQAARPSEGMTEVPAGSHQPTGTTDGTRWRGAEAEKATQLLPPQLPHWGSSLSPAPLFTAQRTPSGPNKWKGPLGRGKTHTCPLHIQKDICARLPKRLTHTKDLPLLPSPLETDKKGSFLVFHKGGAMQGREHTLSKSADLIHPLTDTMRRGRLQEMGRLCPRKDFLQAVNGKLTWKARTKNTQAIGSWWGGP